MPPGSGTTWWTASAPGAGAWSPITPWWWRRAPCSPAGSECGRSTTCFGSLLRRVRIVWITEDLHDQARTAFLRESRRGLSLVDCLSFSVMRAERIRHAFAFDPDFDEQGFLPPPAPASG